jgi:hypothetical protein
MGLGPGQNTATLYPRRDIPRERRNSGHTHSAARQPRYHYLAFARDYESLAGPQPVVFAIAGLGDPYQTVHTFEPDTALVARQGKDLAARKIDFRHRRLRGRLPEPELSAPPLDPTRISMAELYDRLVHDSRDSALAQLGVTRPAPDLLPTAKLNRLLAAAARENDRYINICGIPEGCKELRVQIAQRAFRTGIKRTLQELIITNGCGEWMPI